MAKYILMALLIATLVAYPIFAQEEIAPSSEESIIEEAASSTSPPTAYERELLSHFSERQKEFLKRCAGNIISDCREELFKNLVDDRTVSVSKECCLELLKVGQDCHIGMVRLIFSINEFKEFAPKAIPKSKQTWNTCVRDVGDEIGVPMSPEN